MSDIYLLLICDNHTLWNNLNSVITQIMVQRNNEISNCKKIDCLPEGNLTQFT